LHFCQLFLHRTQLVLECILLDALLSHFWGFHLVIIVEQ
jgi:hypothetical protein